MIKTTKTKRQYNWKRRFIGFIAIKNFTQYMLHIRKSNNLNGRLFENAETALPSSNPYAVATLFEP